MINQERQDGRAVFILGTAPGPDQIVVRSRRDALAQAKALARRERVRVWLTENGHEFSLLHDFVSARTRGTR